MHQDKYGRLAPNARAKQVREAKKKSYSAPTTTPGAASRKNYNDHQPIALVDLDEEDKPTVKLRDLVIAHVSQRFSFTSGTIELLFAHPRNPITKSASLRSGEGSLLITKDGRVGLLFTGTEFQSGSSYELLFLNKTSKAKTFANSLSLDLAEQTTTFRTKQVTTKTLELRFPANIDVSDISRLIEDALSGEEPEWGPASAWWEVPSPLMFWREFEELKNLVHALQQKNEKLEETIVELSDRCNAYDKQNTNKH